MIASIKELYRFRELLWVWTNREVKVRYKQTFLGAAWAVFQPLGMMVAFTVVAIFFRGRIETDGIPYPIFYFTALLPWTFFSGAISSGATSMINSLHLVTKSYFPREILPLAKAGASFFDFLVSLVILAVMFLIYQKPLTWTALWAIPLLLVLIMLSVGLSFLFSALIVYYRDVRYVIPLGMQLLLLLSPILYPAAIIPAEIRTYYMALNPIAALVDTFRRTLLYNSPPESYFLVTVLLSAATFLIGYRVLKVLERSFADII